MFVSRLIGPLMLLSSLALPTQSQAITPPMLDRAQALAAEALSDDLGYQLVESLTTEVGPRLAGTAAEARARQWALAKFEALDTMEPVI